jgi:hypothetical protein
VVVGKRTAYFEDPNLMAGHVADIERVLPGYSASAAGTCQLIVHFSCAAAPALPDTVSAAPTPIAKRTGGLPDGFRLHVDLSEGPGAALAPPSERPQAGNQAGPDLQRRLGRIPSRWHFGTANASN